MWEKEIGRITDLLAGRPAEPFPHARAAQVHPLRRARLFGAGDASCVYNSTQIAAAAAA